jgi:hypothetical protein
VRPDSDLKPLQPRGGYRSSSIQQDMKWRSDEERQEVLIDAAAKSNAAK